MVVSDCFSHSSLPGKVECHLANLYTGKLEDFSESEAMSDEEIWAQRKKCVVGMHYPDREIAFYLLLILTFLFSIGLLLLSFYSRLTRRQ
jgi:hypothetical protein